MKLESCKAPCLPGGRGEALVMCLWVMLGALWYLTHYFHSARELRYLPSGFWGRFLHTRGLLLAETQAVPCQCPWAEVVVTIGGVRRGAL